MSEFECIELDSVEEVSVVKFKDQKLMDPARIEQMGKELLTLVDDDEDSGNVPDQFRQRKFLFQCGD